MKNLWVGLVAAALAFCGCSNDDKEIVNPVPEDGLTLLTEVGASFGLEARTSLDGKQVVWSQGDKISVWSDEQPQPVLFYIDSEGVGQTTATFRVAANSEGVRGTKFYALYPGTATTSITLPSTQGAAGTENFASNVSPMYATTTGKAPEYAELFTFQNICGILPVTLSIDSPNEQLSRIVITSTSPVAGTMDVVFNENTPSYTFTNALYEVTRRCDFDMQEVGKKYTFYVVLPAQKYNLIEIKAYIGSEIGDVLYKSRRAALTIKPGMIANAGADFEIELIEPEPPHAYKVGDVYPYSPEGETVTPQGIVFEVAADGLSGKIVALNDCTENGTPVGSGTRQYFTYSWSTLTDVFEIVDNYPVYNQSNGLSNMEIVKSKLNQFPAFAACAAITTGGLDWYLPASNELALIFNNKGEYLTNLKANGGTDMIAKGYWSSTVQGSEWAMDILYYSQVRPIGIASAPFDGEHEDYAVRAIAQFVVTE